MAHSINEKCIGCGLCAHICPVTAIRGTLRVRHTIDAVACIDCGVCGRVCPADAVDDSAGSTCSRLKREDWPQPEVDYALCISCIACIQACPVGCLGPGPSGSRDPHARPVLTLPDRCIGCGFCADSCPVGAIAMK